MKITSKNIFKVAIMLILLIIIGNGIVALIIPLSDFNFDLIVSNSANSILIGGTMAIGIASIVKWLDKNHPWLKNPLKRLILQVVTTVGYSILVFGISITIMIYFGNDKIQKDEIYDAIWFMMKIGLGFLFVSMLITNAILFFTNWKKSVIIQEQMKREQLNLQYETLKNQVNPHFLFNSLNSITSLIKKDPDKAILFVKELSEVFRFVLEQKDNELSSLNEELKFLESYIYLQKIRFGENLQVNLDVKDRNGFIIPLSLQMLIENAIKHNIISREFPLTISVFSKNDNYIGVSNNLKKKHSVNTSRIGLKNIISRYRFFTTRPVKVTEDELNFMVEIPVIKSVLNN